MNDILWEECQANTLDSTNSVKISRQRQTMNKSFRIFLNEMKGRIWCHSRIPSARRSWFHQIVFVTHSIWFSSEWQRFDRSRVVSIGCWVGGFRFQTVRTWEDVYDDWKRLCLTIEGDTSWRRGKWFGGEEEVREIHHWTERCQRWYKQRRIKLFGCSKSTFHSKNWESGSDQEKWPGKVVTVTAILLYGIGLLADKIVRRGWLASKDLSFMRADMEGSSSEDGGLSRMWIHRRMDRGVGSLDTVAIAKCQTLFVTFHGWLSRLTLRIIGRSFKKLETLNGVAS
jgi:hypothetical protein